MPSVPGFFRLQIGPIELIDPIGFVEAIELVWFCRFALRLMLFSIKKSHGTHRCAVKCAEYQRHRHMQGSCFEGFVLNC